MSIRSQSVGNKPSQKSQTASSQKFLPIELQQPDQLLQTEIPVHEFSNALFASLDTLPDVPQVFCNYEPQTSVQTLPEYPQEPNQKILQPEFFRRFDLSTLLYIFFYFPGTSQQLFAAKELKARGWRYHAKFQTWFKRVSQPKTVTKEYEIADYDYFDHSSAENWYIRRRTNFQFDFNCLAIDL